MMADIPSISRLDSKIEADDNRISSSLDCCDIWLAIQEELFKLIRLKLAKALKLIKVLV